MQDNAWVFNGYYTLIAATIVLLIGRLMVKKIKFLQDFNIPEPVSGGLLAALVLTVLHSVYGVSFQFDKSLQTAFMLIFFTSIGLSADFSRLKAGGVPLVVFTLVVGAFILVQNAVGVGLASALGQDPLLGLIAGSITLTGGHGTAGAWGPTFEQKFGFVGATGLGIAAATFGLVFGGLIGGPVARRLINKQGRAQIDRDTVQEDNRADDVFENHDKVRLITADSAVETLAMFAACLAFAEIVDGYDKEYFYDLPKFVWCLFAGVVLRNILTIGFKMNMFDRAVDVFGNASLSLFLAIALLDLKLWQLAGMAGPMAIILAVQTVVMILYATFVTYVVMGRDYDAAVLSAGHCGFGLGATPTAVANMQSITQSFGPSHKAFLIVPMVGAFFVDLINAAILTGFVEFLKK
ncbi:sodium/glutamate symporter [Neisseria sp. 23W00296]|uniref:sodium/glutamate symporter n=1 Tax=unclassified Neisseria TaxID=2623750 RepID=UPI0002A27485|nr:MULTISPECIES: sodium/glutamate symporter [unclassified Neisseria]ASP16307.1 sodium/glutamate symporter [Neisseria sp. KEM232]EKY03504.1 sodium/glutamate symporter [Neisseria sp. oral taxon 020 str. F0370]